MANRKRRALENLLCRSSAGGVDRRPGPRNRPHQGQGRYWGEILLPPRVRYPALQETRNLVGTIPGPSGAAEPPGHGGSEKDALGQGGSKRYLPPVDQRFSGGRLPGEICDPAIAPLPGKRWAASMRGAGSTRTTFPGFGGWWKTCGRVENPWIIRHRSSGRGENLAPTLRRPCGGRWRTTSNGPWISSLMETFGPVW